MKRTILDSAIFLEIFPRLALALLAGIVLGLNRWLLHKAAGVRTHSLVAIAAALAILIIGDDVHDQAQAVSRVLQGLLTGLGFLGAGVIIREPSNQKINGLTTAASLWVCAIIGAAFGGGHFILGLSALGFIIFILLAGGSIEDIARKIVGNSKISESPTTPIEEINSK